MQRRLAECPWKGTRNSVDQESPRPENSIALVGHLSQGMGREEMRAHARRRAAQPALDIRDSATLRRYKRLDFAVVRGALRTTKMPSSDQSLTSPRSESNRRCMLASPDRNSACLTRRKLSAVPRLSVIAATLRSILEKIAALGAASIAGGAPGASRPSISRWRWCPG